MKLKGKKAIITGANRSIGKAIAVAFAKEGADALISYRSDEEGASKTVAFIEKLGRQAKAVYADFSQFEDIKLFFDEAVDFLGQVDLLVNNAAGYDTSDFLNLNPDDFNQLLQIGVAAPMLLTQMVAHQMVGRGVGGSIINISSISGLRPFQNRVAHSTAKAALNMLTKSCALELGKFNIRINAIAPGSTPYDSSKEGFAIEGIPLIRAGTPEDQANAAVFLASEDSAWMTGQVMVVDGGHILSC